MFVHDHDAVTTVTNTDCYLSLPPANVVCEGYVFTGVCLSTGGSASVHARIYTLCQGDPPAKETPCQGDPPAKETPCQGDTPLLPRRPLFQGDPLPRRPPFQWDPLPRRHPQAYNQGGGEIKGDQIQAHTQGGNWGGSDPGPHPRGKLRGIRSRPTPKGEIEGDQIQTYTQGGNSGESGPDPPHDDYCWGRYASYWNAFLLSNNFSVISSVRSTILHVLWTKS